MIYDMEYVIVALIVISVGQRIIISLEFLEKFGFYFGVVYVEILIFTYFNCNILIIIFMIYAFYYLAELTTIQRAYYFIPIINFRAFAEYLKNFFIII